MAAYKVEVPPLQAQVWWVHAGLTQLYFFSISLTYSADADIDCDVQVYLVTGGCTARNTEGQCTAATDTTEVLSAGDLDWVYTALLPSARFANGGPSINNRIIISGEC